MVPDASDGLAERFGTGCYTGRPVRRALLQGRARRRGRKIACRHKTCSNLVLADRSRNLATSSSSSAKLEKIISPAHAVTFSAHRPSGRHWGSFNKAAA
eukprot:491175-Karenia_brevis.AAC.1